MIYGNRSSFALSWGLNYLGDNLPCAATVILCCTAAIVLWATILKSPTLTGSVKPVGLFIGEVRKMILVPQVFSAAAK